MPNIFKHFSKWTQSKRKKPFVFESSNEKDIQRFLLGIQVAKAAAEKGQIHLKKISDQKIALHAIKERLSQLDQYTFKRKKRTKKNNIESVVTGIILSLGIIIPGIATLFIGSMMPWLPLGFIVGGIVFGAVTIGIVRKMHNTDMKNMDIHAVQEKQTLLLEEKTVLSNMIERSYPSLKRYPSTKTTVLAPINFESKERSVADLDTLLGKNEHSTKPFKKI